MAKVIKKPEEIFAEITADFQQACGADLLSIILYGSGTGNYYLPGQSDINFLVILKEVGIVNLEQCLAVIGKWEKRRVAAVFMTPAYIADSQDAFPVELLNMQLNHLVVYGEDVLAELKLAAGDLRLQLERELRGKVLHLQQGFLACGGKAKGLRQLIGLSLGSFLPLFTVLLFLRGYKTPPGRRDLIKALSLAYPVKADVFLQAIDIREKRSKLSGRELKELFKSYHHEIARLAKRIDNLEV